MRIERLHLQNFRGFAEVEFDFSKAGNLVVFVGKNGAGKSTVLGCLGMFNGRYVFSNASSDGAAKVRLERSDIKRGADFAAATITYEVDVPPSLRLTDTMNLQSDGTHSSSTELLEYARAHLVRLDKQTSVPLLFEYPSEGFILVDGWASRNSFNAFEDGAIKPQLNAYAMEFEPDAVGQFQTFLKWFRTQEDIENQTRLRKDPNHRSKQLEPVRTAIEKFLQALPGNARICNLRVEREAIENESALFKVSERVSYVIDKDDETFDLAQLSDGERSTLLFVADIAMRLVIANPAQANPLLGTGIVLVDEIERHLHPAWQRAILGGLMATFPNIQFIVTTHSPQVLSKVPHESVFLLDRFQLVTASHTYGRDSNAILEDVMGVSERPEEAVDKIRAIGRLLDADQIESARQKLSELETWFGEGDTEISRLRRLIDFAS